jgi:hypothetical protein
MPHQRKDMTSKPSACRRLDFDVVDNSAAGVTETPELRPEIGNDNLKNPEFELRSYLEKKKRQWNFDFVNEVPLNGKWEWIKVEASEPPTVEGQADAENEDSELDADK